MRLVEELRRAFAPGAITLDDDVLDFPVYAT